MDERKSLILEERKGDMAVGHGFTRRTFIKGSAAIGAMAAISGCEPKEKISCVPRWVMSHTPTLAAAERSSATSSSAVTALGTSP